MSFTFYYLLNKVTGVLLYSGSDFAGAKEVEITSEYSNLIPSSSNIVTVRPYNGGTTVVPSDDWRGEVIYGCSHLTDLDVTGIDLSTVKYHYIAGSCPKLTNMICGNISQLNYSYSSALVPGCGIDSDSVLNITIEKTPTDWGHAFDSNNYGTINVKSPNPIVVTNCTSMFNNCQYLTSVDLTSMDMSGIADITTMFFNCYSLKTIKMGRIKTDGGSSIYNVFTNVGKNLLDDETVDISMTLVSGSTCRSLFSENDFPNLKLDLTFEGDVTDFSYMFSSSKRLKNLDLTNIDFSKSIKMSYAFGNMPYLETIKIDTINEIDVSSTSWSLIANSGNGTNRDTRNLSITINKHLGTHLDNICGGSNFKNIVFKLLEKEQWSDPTYIKYMFGYSPILEKVYISLPIPKESTTIIDVSALCAECPNIELIEFDKLNAVKCSSYGIDYSSNEYSNRKITLRINDSSELLYLYGLFMNSPRGEIVLDFDVSHVTNAGYLFFSARYVYRIESDDFQSTDRKMFLGNLALQGANGTTYLGLTGGNESTWLTDKYAHADGGSTNPGLFWKVTRPNTVEIVVTPQSAAVIEPVINKDGCTFDIKSTASNVRFVSYYYTTPTSSSRKGATREIDKAKIKFETGNVGVYTAYFNFVQGKPTGEGEYDIGQTVLPDKVINGDKIDVDYDDDWIRHGSGGMYGIFTPTETQLVSFASWIYSETFANSMAKLFQEALGLNINIQDLIIQYCVYPFAVSKVQGKTKPVKVGWFTPLDSDSQILMDFTYSNYEVIDCGQLYVEPIYNNFLDYKCSVEIYLPYIGYQNLETYDVIGHTINPVYYVDLLTGNCVCLINIDNSVKYQFTGTCGYQIAVGSTDQNQIISKGISTATMIAGATGVIPPQVISTADIVNHSSPSITKINRSRSGDVSSISRRGGDSERHAVRREPLVTPREVLGNFTNIGNGITRGGNITGNTGFVSIQTPFLDFSYPNIDVPGNYAHLNGYPCNKYLNLGACKGYTQVGEIHLKNIPCTNEELDEIETLLSRGVYL